MAGAERRETGDMSSHSRPETRTIQARSTSMTIMAVEHETTIAAIIHEWIQEHLEEVEK